ncbi:MAG TPA: VOC family protein [Gemmatimonadaceae bacterium]|nr:VOC family protein [Gemmatimonadaceae bacterium]
MKKLFIIAAALLCSSPLGAQATTASHKAFGAITVANLDSASAWYERNLGTKRVSYSRARSGVAENAVVANDYMMIELIHFTAKAPSDTTLVNSRDVGLQKLGVWVDRSTFEATLAHLQKQEATFLGGVFTDEKISARMFIVRDNSGVLIQFFTRSEPGM